MSAEDFAPLRETVEFAAKWDPVTVKLNQEKIMLLERLLREHAERGEDAERWRYVRRFMLSTRWELSPAATLTMHCWRVPPVANPDATVEEIIDAARLRSLSSSPHPTDNQ